MFRAPLKQVFVYAFLASAAAFLPTHANAAVISIGWEQDGGGIITQWRAAAFPTPLAASFSTGDFNVVPAAAERSRPCRSPGLLVSNNLSISSAGGHSLDLWVTASGLTGPLGNPQGFFSNLTQNDLAGPFTTTLESLLDPANGLFTGTVLGSASFAPPPAAPCSRPTSRTPAQARTRSRRTTTSYAGDGVVDPKPRSPSSRCQGRSWAPGCRA